MSEWYLLALGVALTLGTGVFVASEFSLINLERTELERRQEQGERGLAPSIRALKRSSTHLSSAQIGITITTMLTGFLAEPALSKIIEPALAFLDLSQGSDVGALQSGSRYWKVLHCSPCLRTIKSVYRNLYFTHGVVFNAVFHWLAFRCLFFVSVFVDYFMSPTMTIGWISPSASL